MQTCNGQSNGQTESESGDSEKLLSLQQEHSEHSVLKPQGIWWRQRHDSPPQHHQRKHEKKYRQVGRTPHANAKQDIQTTIS